MGIAIPDSMGIFIRKGKMVSRLSYLNNGNSHTCHHGNSHHKDKTVSQPSYVYNVNPYTWKDNLYIELDMSTACRCLKSPRSLSATSAHPTMVTQVNIMVMNGWLTSFSFIVNRLPHSWDKTISDTDLETPRSRSWVWSKGKVIQLAQYHINSLPFHLTSIRPTILGIELFRNLTLKHPRSMSWGRSKVNVTYCTQYPTNALPFCFTSIGPTILEIWPK